VAGFHRYSLAKRNGLSYFAAYLGRFPVRQVPTARLVDQLDRWLGPYRRMAGGDKLPPRFAAAVRRIDAAVYDVCRYGDTPQYLQAVLRAAGRAERELAKGTKVRVDFPGLRPLARLSAAWLPACDDGSPEYRLAASLAFMPSRRDRHRPARMYLEPVVRAGKAGWKFDDSAKGVVWSDADLPTNLAAILARRLRDGVGGSQESVDADEGRFAHPLWTAARFRPALADVLQFLDDDTDDDKLTDLLWALPAVDPGDRDFRFAGRPVVPVSLMADFSNLKLSLLPESVIRPGATAETVVRNEARVVPLLVAGRLNEAVAVACRRLQASGLPPISTAPIAGRMKPARDFVSTPARTRRLAAALLFPLRPGAIRQLVELSIREAKPEP
jgi:CRISPR-associated protein Csx17